MYLTITIDAELPLKSGNVRVIRNARACVTYVTVEADPYTGQPELIEVINLESPSGRRLPRLLAALRKNDHWETSIHEEVAARW